MNSEFYTELTKGVIGIAGLVITGALIPYISNKIGSEKLKKYVNWATIAAEAAEKIYASHKGSDKSDLKNKFVTDFLKKMFGNKLTDEQITVLLESSVYKLGNEIFSSIESLPEKPVKNEK